MAECEEALKSSKNLQLQEKSKSNDNIHMSRGAALMKFSRLTQDKGINFVLENIRGTSSNNKDEIEIDTEDLSRSYKEFDERYKDLVNTFLNMKKEFHPADQLTSETKTLAKTIKHEHGMKWNTTVKCKAVELTAFVFALWTIQNGTDCDSYLILPRAAQVISIIRLLSIDECRKDKRLDRNLVEIGAGEGKSLIIGVTSAVLALLGYDVSCACYSDYLSQRDYYAFEELLNALGVANSVHYGTLNQVCERIINDGGNITQLTEELILPAGNGADRLDDEKKMDAIEEKGNKILIVDEIDMFFNEEFYGNVYVPGATLRDKTITRLTDWIWKQHNEKQDARAKKEREKREPNNENKNDKVERESDEFNVTVGMIRNSKEYLNCSNVFGEWKPLLDEAIKDMVHDLKTFKSDDYLVIDGKIECKESDRETLSTSQMHGYRTLWAYYYEHDAHKITRETLESIAGIYLKCGIFSYSQILSSKFNSILGVAGTLTALLAPQRQIMKETYGIDKYTYMPSLFGKSKFSFDEKEDIILAANTLEFHEILKEEIGKRLKQFGQGRERCVFVFFENEKKMMDFYYYDGFAVFKPRTLILTQKLTKNEIMASVRKAVTSNRILLSTRSFGHGTDFVVRDGIVAHNGGPHVIQTFVSDQLSEEKQIQARTARQGGDGSYSMVLIKCDLEKYGMVEDDVKIAIENKNLYDVINEKRHDFIVQGWKANSQFVKESLQTHKESEIFLKALKDKDRKVVINRLKSYNMGARCDKVKVAVLVDATASMGKLLQKAKDTVGIMYSAISEILQDKKIDSNCFELQFIAYRNYNAPSDELLRYSGWCNNSVSLRHFLDAIEASYGWGNEAAEAGLSYVQDMIKKHNNEINEIIIIGDAGFNTNELIVKKMKQKGKKYWALAGFDDTNTAFDYLPFFKQLGIKINGFYLHERAKADFERIAKETNGESCFLNVNDEKNSSEILTRLISESVLNAAGGAAFVKAYREKYGNAGVQVANK